MTHNSIRNTVTAMVLTFSRIDLPGTFQVVFPKGRRGARTLVRFLAMSPYVNTVIGICG